MDSVPCVYFHTKSALLRWSGWIGRKFRQLQTVYPDVDISRIGSRVDLVGNIEGVEITGSVSQCDIQADFMRPAFSVRYAERQELRMHGALFDIGCKSERV